MQKQKLECVCVYTCFHVSERWRGVKTLGWSGMPEKPLLSVRARTGDDAQESFSVIKSTMTVKLQNERLILVHLQSRKTEGNVAASHCPCSPYHPRHIFQVVLL